MRLYSILRKAIFASSYGLVAFGILTGFFCVTQKAYSGEQPELVDINEDLQELGKSIVFHYWTNVKHQNVKAYSDKLAFGFQGISINGIYTRKEQINGLRNSNLKKFKLAKVLTVLQGNTLVISYELHAKGKGITSGPSMDIWQRIDSHWLMISHSYVPLN